MAALQLISVATTKYCFHLFADCSEEQVFRIWIYHVVGWGKFVPKLGGWSLLYDFFSHFVSWHTYLSRLGLNFARNRI